MTHKLLSEGIKSIREPDIEPVPKILLISSQIVFVKDTTNLKKALNAQTELIYLVIL